MDFTYLLVIGVLLLVIFSSFMIARIIYGAVNRRNTKWAWPVGILSFLIFFFAISISILAIVFSNMEFSR